MKPSHGNSTHGYARGEVQVARVLDFPAIFTRQKTGLALP